MAKFSGRVGEVTEASSGRKLRTYTTCVVTILVTYGILRLDDPVSGVLSRGPRQFVSGLHGGPRRRPAKVHWADRAQPRLKEQLARDSPHRRLMPR